MSAKTLLLLAVAVALGACNTNPSGQQLNSSCQPPSDLSSLSGTYTAENIGINKSGKHSGTSTLSIAVDRDGVISGERTWSSKTHQGYTIDGTATNSDKEPVIGVIDPADCEIGLAEKGETGSYRGRLLSDGSIDLILIDSGDAPLAIRNRYERQAQ